jgi:hypothetical protein
MRSAILRFAVVMLAWPGLAQSQVSTTPVALGPAIDTHRPLADLDDLTRLYNSGDWPALQQKAQGLLAAAGVSFDRHYVILVWIAADPFGKRVLARAVVHAPAASEPFSPDLPGVGVRSGAPEVYEAFLSRGTRGKLVSVYASSRDADPLPDTMPAFVRAIASPVFATFGTFAGPVSQTRGIAAGPPDAASAPPPPTVAVTVARVGLPFERATIKWQASAREPAEIAAFRDATDTFVQDLAFSAIPNSSCGRAVATILGEALKDASAGPECAAAAATISGCRARFDTVIRAAEAAALDKTSPDPACAAPSRDDLSAVAKVDAAFREFATASMTAGADADLTFRNRPNTHWGFGAGSGVLAINAALTRPRVSLRNGVIVADPLPRVMTAAFVNWSPAGYDASLEPVSAAERLRPFVGVTVTPDFGVTAGLNLVLVRGIGITFGGVVMIAKGAGPDDIGKAPANPEQPYARSYASGLVVGISYNVK